MITTYDYRCQDCHTLFEVRRDWNSPAGEALCPKCGSLNSRRVYTAVLTLSRSADGAMQNIGASGCGTCAASSCSGCASSRN